MKSNPSSEKDTSISEDSDKGNDKPASDELTKTPLVNLPYGYVLWNELTKLQRSNNNNNKLAISRRREITKTLLDIYSSPKARFVAAQLWDLKASTTDELMTLTGFSSRVIDHTRNNLIRIGLLRSTLEIKSPSGKRGPKPWVYAIGIADENDSVEAKLRFDEIVKQKNAEDKALKRESRRLDAMEVRARAKARDLLRDTKLQTLVTQYIDLNKETNETVSFEEIKQGAKSVGLDEPLAFMDVAIALEEKGIQTGYFVDGKLDHTAKLHPKILEIRKRREIQR